MSWKCNKKSQAVKNMKVNEMDKYELSEAINKAKGFFLIQKSTFIIAVQVVILYYRP